MSQEKPIITVWSGFEHEALPDPQTYIRLLKITEAKAGKLARCALSTWPLESAPPYCAISYTWGDPIDVVEVEINRKRMIVRRNCEDVIRQVYASGWRGNLWIDAVCIDQGNNHEKSLQVAMMGDIYKGAARVFACVGPAADDSDFLIGFLKRHKSFFDRNYARMTAKDELDLDEEALTVEHSDHHFPHGPALWRPGESWLSLLLRRTRIVHAFIHFMKRPYFSRVWILQELFAGNRRITICCGTMWHPLSSFFVLDLLIYRLKYTRSAIPHLTALASKIVWFLSCKLVKPLQYNDRWVQTTDLELHDKYLLFGAKTRPQPIDFRATWLWLSDLQCEDPRDRIYGIRSLIKWPGGRAPVPDYDKDSFVLAKEIIELLNTEKPSTNLIWCRITLIHLAISVWQSLIEPREHPGLKEVLRARRHVSRLQERPLPRGSGRRIGDVRWKGLRVGDLFALECREGYTGLILPEDVTGKASFYAPEHIQLDDWIIACEGSRLDMEPGSGYFESDDIDRLILGGLDSKVLVLRASADDGYYTILGQVYEGARSGFYPHGYKSDERLIAKRFIVWWDAEDLLVFAWREWKFHDDIFDLRLDIYFGGRFDIWYSREEVDACFGGRFSAVEGASYAKGPFSAAEVKAKLEDDPDTALLEPE